MEKPVCNRCGSDAVLRDAYAEWDVEKQDWVLQNVFDDAFCEDCEGECKLEWKDIPDPQCTREECSVIGQLLGGPAHSGEAGQ